MRACIVTFQSAYNYGAVLQAYALQDCLNKQNIETRILDYHNTGIDKSYSAPNFKDFIKKPKNAVFRAVQSVLFKGKNNKIDVFRNDKLRLTRRYDASTVASAIDEADVFITGSDQVWNYLLIDRDSSYFLDFAKGKKTCSYAASFGVGEIPETYQQFYRQHLSHIDYVSVREEKGIELVKRYGNKEAALLPDPTLLLDKSEWEKLCVKPYIETPYILVYKITKADKLLDFAKELSKKTGLPIVYIPNDLKAGIIGKLKLSVGPEEWLGFIKNAEYVVTNSFHGTVFSILFERKFFAEVSKKVNPSTSRLSSLLKMFDLENRTFDNYTDAMLSEELSNDNIDEQLKVQKGKALEFFKEVFNGENDVIA